MYRGEYMKNAITYYYDLNPDNIHQKDNNYFFNIGNNYYVLSKYNRDIKELESIYNLSNNLLNNGIYNHQMIPNKNNSLLTPINNNLYVLMKLYDDMKKKIKFDDVVKFSKIIGFVKQDKILKRDNWSTLWSNKIDYFEYQVNQFGKKYPLIRESFSYFIGLAENGISLYNDTEKNSEYITVSHIRINKNSTLYDLYNPLNFILDYPARDISEYLKSKIMSGNDIFEDLNYYLSNYHPNNYEIQLFFIRMLYPSFYFDKYEQIMAGSSKELELNPIIAKVDDYENIIKKMYSYLSYYTKLPEIDWLKNS